MKLLLISSLLVGIAPFGLRGYTALRYRAAVYTAENVPPKPVAIIFGAQVMPSGRLSAMLADRVRAGVDLYHAGKVEILLMTGDHATPHYNEPAAMQAFAMRLGVPAEAIWLDYAGLRTYDSCYRAKAMFNITEAVLVTQAFHLDRALLLCEAMGIAGVGVAADYHRPDGYSERAMRWSRWREIAATAVAFWDVLWQPAPRLGTRMPAHVLEEA